MGKKPNLKINAPSKGKKRGNGWSSTKQKTRGKAAAASLASVLAAKPPGLELPDGFDYELRADGQIMLKLDGKKLKDEYKTFDWNRVVLNCNNATEAHNNGEIVFAGERLRRARIETKPGVWYMTWTLHPDLTVHVPLALVTPFMRRTMFRIANRVVSADAVAQELASSPDLQYEPSPAATPDPEGAAAAALATPAPTPGLDAPPAAAALAPPAATSGPNASPTPDAPDQGEPEPVFYDDTAVADAVIAFIRQHSATRLADMLYLNSPVKVALHALLAGLPDASPGATPATRLDALHNAFSQPNRLRGVEADASIDVILTETYLDAIAAGEKPPKGVGREYLFQWLNTLERDFFARANVVCALFPSSCPLFSSSPQHARAVAQRLMMLRKVGRSGEKGLIAKLKKELAAARAVSHPLAAPLDAFRLDMTPEQKAALVRAALDNAGLALHPTPCILKGLASGAGVSATSMGGKAVKELLAEIARDGKRPRPETEGVALLRAWFEDAPLPGGGVFFIHDKTTDACTRPDIAFILHPDWETPIVVRIEWDEGDHWRYAPGSDDARALGDYLMADPFPHILFRMSTHKADNTTRSSLEEMCRLTELLVQVTHEIAASKEKAVDWVKPMGFANTIKIGGPFDVGRDGVKKVASLRNEDVVGMVRQVRAAFGKRAATRARRFNSRPKMLAVLELLGDALEEDKDATKYDDKKLETITERLASEVEAARFAEESSASSGSDGSGGGGGSGGSGGAAAATAAGGPTRSASPPSVAGGWGCGGGGG